MASNRFFKLDDTQSITDWDKQEEFVASLPEKELCDKRYMPDLLERKENGFNSIGRITFRNVSFSKTAIKEISFTKCLFEDCLFIGTEFIGCKFHNCIFKRCNFWEADFTDCYADPWLFRDANDLENYSNVAIGLFQSLIANAEKESQSQHKAHGEFFFLQAKRYQLKYDLRDQTIQWHEYLLKYPFMWLFEKGTGYGWRPLRVLRSIVIIFIIFNILNYLLWPYYWDHSEQMQAAPEQSIISALFYTSSVFTTLGPGDHYPNSTLGLLMMSAQCIMGVVVFALVASMVFKLVVRK